MNYSHKNTFNSKTVAILVAVIVVISIFIPATKTIADTWYDSGWIYVNDLRFHADMVDNECLNEVGYTFDDVQKIYIAGGFGKFLDIEKAIILGMLPELPKEKFEYMGNTSGVGAYLCLISQKLRGEAEEISRKMTYVELSVSRSFMDEYVSGLFIPHTNMDDFPGVKELMEK